MDITALFLALPRLSADLHASSVEQLWITDSYGFAVAGFVIIMGALGDRVGRRRLLLIGGAAFAVVSVLAVWATAQFVGGAIGPVLAGVLLARFWWGSVFLMAVPVMVLLLVAGPAVLPEYRSPAPGAVDLASAGLSLAAVLLVVFGLKQLAVGASPGLAVPPGSVVAAVIFAGLAALIAATRPGRAPAGVPAPGVPAAEVAAGRYG
jgi:DHA2 family multidrug resistance protein-like MFS transporter